MCRQPVLAGWAALMTLYANAAAAVEPALPAINTNNVAVVTNAAYGAVGDGVFTNTVAIQSAINAAARGGLTNGLYGGTVEIPAPGVYQCSPVNFCNYVNLQVNEGATLRMLPFDKYPGGDISPRPLVNGSSLHGIAITGLGMIDGQGLPCWKDIETNSAAVRPVIVNFGACSRVLIQDITCTNSPSPFFVIKGNGGGVVQNCNYCNPAMTNVNWPLLIYSCYESGLGTNWVTVPNSSIVMAANLIVDPANGSVFLRLAYP